MLLVTVHLYSQSQPITHDQPLNTYTKDGLFCVRDKDGSTHKYPVQHIFRVIED